MTIRRGPLVRKTKGFYFSCWVQHAGSYYTSLENRVRANSTANLKESRNRQELGMPRSAISFDFDLSASGRLDSLIPQRIVNQLAWPGHNSISKVKVRRGTDEPAKLRT